MTTLEVLMALASVAAMVTVSVRCTLPLLRTFKVPVVPPAITVRS